MILFVVFKVEMNFLAYIFQNYLQLNPVDTFQSLFHLNSEQLST